MAVKDLPSTVLMDLKVLVWFADQYGRDIGGENNKVIGDWTKDYEGRRWQQQHRTTKYSGLNEAVAGLQSWYSSNTGLPAPVPPIRYNPTTDKTALVWVPYSKTQVDANFFNLKVWLLTVCAPDDPVVASFDLCRQNFKNITSTTTIPRAPRY